jgi:hypothetical protein
MHGIQYLRINSVNGIEMSLFASHKIATSRNYPFNNHTKPWRRKFTKQMNVKKYTMDDVSITYNFLPWDCLLRRIFEPKSD